MVEAYQDEAAKSGRKFPLGKNTACLRSMHIGSSYNEAYTFGSQVINSGWIPYFGGFGFFEAFRFPGEKGLVPVTYERIVEAKYSLVGTVDDIKRDPTLSGN